MDTPRVHKPPLYTWLSALVFELTGPSLAAQRSISILAILGTARPGPGPGPPALRLGPGVRPGRDHAAGIQRGFPDLLTRARTDTLLLFLVTASAYSFVRVLTGTGEGHRLVPVGLSPGRPGSFLTKGPYGLLHALPAGPGRRPWSGPPPGRG